MLSLGSAFAYESLFHTAYFDLETDQDLNNLTKPINYDESHVIGKGAFGAVYDIQIHPDQRSFSSVGRSLMRIE